MDLLTLVIQKWEIVAALASTGASIFILWLSSRFMPRAGCKAIRDGCESVHKEMRMNSDKQEKRLDEASADRARIEALLRGLPTAADAHKLQLSIAELNGRLNSFEATMRGQADLLKIVQQQTTHMNAFLMEHGHGAKR